MPKNILILHTDQQRYDSLGCTGDASASTPNIDRLAAEGTCFTRHYAANPVCTPSRCSLLTGYYPPGHGSWSNGIALARKTHEHPPVKVRFPVDQESVIPQIPTFADRLKEMGYHTAAFGKLHLTPNLAHGAYGYRESTPIWQSGKNRDWHGPYYGFDYVELTDGHGESPCLHGHYADWLAEHHPELVQQIKAGAKHDVPAGKAPVWQSVIPSELHHSLWLAGRFRDYLRNHIDEIQKQSIPFFSFIGFPDPHHAICPSYDLAAQFADADVPLPVDRQRRKRFFATDCLKDVSHYSDDDYRHLRRYTAAMIKGIDLAVGEIIATLEEFDLLKDTVIVFTSDHGDMLGDHGYLHKGNLCLEPLLHVPFIIRDPQRRLPPVWDGLMSNVDVLPTLMALAGCPPPDDIDGVDISAPGFDPQDHAIFAYALHEDIPRQNLAVYRQHYKLVYFPHADHAELYDLKEDPHEITDLASRAEYRRVKDELLALAGSAFMRHNRGIGHRVCLW